MSGTAPPFPLVYLKCSLWNGIFRSINLGIKSKRWALFIRFTPRISLPTQLMRPLLILGYSEGTSGRFSCKILFWFFSNTLFYTATNRACKLTENGRLILPYYQVWNIISKLFFINTFELSASWGSVTLKTLVLDRETSVKCNNQTLMEKKFPPIFLVKFTTGNLRVKLNSISHIRMHVCINLYVLITYVLMNYYIC